MSVRHGLRRYGRPIASVKKKATVTGTLCYRRRRAPLGPSGIRRLSAIWPSRGPALFLERHDRRRGTVGRGALVVGGQVRIAGRGRGCAVAEQRANDREAVPLAGE